MGDDAPPAFLSSLPRPLWDYCKQRFAQVTNPPIDPLRESHVMSLDVYLGKRTKLNSPLVDAGQMAAIAEKLSPIHRIDITFEVAGGVDAARDVLRRIREEAAAPNAGAIVLSDHSLNGRRAAVPALLAVSAAWRAMTEAGAWNVPLLVETGQAIDTHHVALLIAAGASAVHPYLAMSLAARADINGSCDGVSRYRAAIEKGLRKVLARMGISTMSSYRNSQIFETIGIDAEVCDEFFEDAGRTLSGVSLDDLLRDCITCHAAGFGASEAEFRDAGLYRFRRNGEQHASSPEFVRRMHRYIKSPTPANQAALAVLTQERKNVAVRDLLEFRPAQPLSLDDVESEVSLLSRFSTQAMSLGAISPEAHQTLAIAMNRLGGRSNTGEGGEDPSIYYERPEANNRVKQVASARFGVTAEYLVHADEIEIKMAQGSKPGEGGQLPSVESHALHCAATACYPGNLADLAATAPRYLQHRRPGAVDLRFARRESECAHWGETGFEFRSWRDCDRRGESRCGCHHDQRARWRHRRVAAYFDQEHRLALGDWFARCAFCAGSGWAACARQIACGWRS